MREPSVTLFGFRLSERFAPRQIDWIVVGAAVVLSVPRVVRSAGVGQLAASLELLPLATVPLLWRRRSPGSVLVVLTAVLVVSPALGLRWPTNVGPLLALYAAALYGDLRLRALTGAIAAIVTVMACATLLATDNARGFAPLTVAVFGAGGAWVLGELARTREVYVTELEDRAARLQHDHDEHVRRAAEEERIRIARELHDVVTHHVSAIAVQAGAAHSTSRSRPERALDTLGVIERTARSTLGELRTLLGVLRAGDEQAALAPLRPRRSLRELDELVADARAAGIEVELQVLGNHVPLDAVVDLSAYRVLQEALTNVIKHAPAASASVLVTYGSTELGITVADDGTGPPEGNHGGHGLIGMRERVELAGGSLEAGPTAGGGFRVRASLPINQPACGDGRVIEPNGAPEADRLVRA